LYNAARQWNNNGLGLFLSRFKRGLTVKRKTEQKTNKQTKTAIEKGSIHPLIPNSVYYQNSSHNISAL